MNNISRLYKHLDRLCPITPEGHINMTNVNSVNDLCRIFDITNDELYGWIYSHYPNKIFSIRYINGLSYYKKR